MQRLAILIRVLPNGNRSDRSRATRPRRAAYAAVARATSPLAPPLGSQTHRRAALERPTTQAREMASQPINADVLAAMRDAAMATAQAQLKLAAACAAALGEDAPKLTKDGRKARGKREKDPNRPAYAETAYQLFMKETRATNTTLPKGKEAMVLSRTA